MAVLVLGAVFLGAICWVNIVALALKPPQPDSDVLPEVQAILDSKFMGEIPVAETQERSAIRGLVSAYNDRFTVFVEPVSREDGAR